MTQISVSELKVNAGKYVGIAQEEDVFITKNGKVVAKLVTAKVDKHEALDHLLKLFDGVQMTDEEIKAAREERFQ